MKTLFALLIICLLASACTYQSGTNTSDIIINTSDNNTINKINNESSDDMLAVNDSNDGILTDDLMSCTSMLGKTAQQAGIPESVLKELTTGTYKTYIDGNIFGIKDYGVIYLSSDIHDSTQPPKVTSVWIHIKGLDYDKCRSELISLYGGPESEREEPYAEVNGGAVTWARFTDDDTIIRLSRASEREYVELDLEKAKN